MYYVVVDGYNGYTGNYGLNIDYSVRSQEDEGYFTFDAQIERETRKMESSGFSNMEIDFALNQNSQQSIVLNNSRNEEADCGILNTYQIYNSLDNTLIH